MRTHLLYDIPGFLIHQLFMIIQKLNTIFIQITSLNKSIITRTTIMFIFSIANSSTTFTITI